jgi:PAS domain S-box-containing protein
MPDQKTSTNGRTHLLALAGFSLSVLATVALAVFAYRFSDRQVQAAIWVDHTQEVLAALTKVRATLGAGGREMRDYVISGADRDLNRYVNTLSHLKNDVGLARGLTADNASQQVRFESFEAALQVRLASVQNILDARRNQGFAAAQQLVEADISSQQTTLVLDGLGRIEQQERELLRARDGDEQAAMLRFRLSAAALVVLAALALGCLYWALRRQRAAQRRWLQSEQRFRLMAESTAEYAIVMLDPAGVVATWNPGAARIKGYSADEIVGRHFSCFYTPEDVAQGKPEKWLKTAAAVGHARDEGWRVRKDGSRFWADVVITTLRDDAGAVSGYAKLTRDMTERQQAEQSLRHEIAQKERVEAGLMAMNESLADRVAVRTYELQTINDNLQREITTRGMAQESLQLSESRLRGILDSAMDAIITIDESEHIMLFNAAAEAIFGCPQKEALGAPLAWFIPQRFRATHSDHVRLFAAAGTASRRMGSQRIVTGLRRNGEEFPIEASISQVAGAGGKFFTVILRDVTERVRAEQALRHSKDELRELAAMASSAREQEKSRVARELHDELAQSLTALKMDLSWALERLGPEQTPVRAKLEEMGALLDSAAVATRRIAADLRPLMLDDLGLIPAAEWLVQNFTQRTGIHCEFATDPPHLELRDPHATAFFRILQESLANIGKHAHASLVEVSIQAHDGDISLKVRDNGRGFLASDPRKPNSFGLAGLRERAYLLDGDIRIESAPGRGTTVEVHVPMPTE